MDYELLKERIEIITSRIKYIGGEVQEVCIDEPSSLEQIIQVEEKLGIKLPNSFKKVLLEFSGNFSLRWFLPDDVELPNEFTDIFCGTPHWSLESLSEFEKERKDLVDEVFSNLDDEYDVVWHNKLAFCEVGNGDYLAFDMKDDIDAPIIYLSHDDGEGHGYKIANNFIEFIENWSRVAFVGCEDWQWLPFTTSFESGINPDDEPAKKFRTCLELNI
ncbi:MULTISPECIES: SMI1/KNR4 family protein [Bacillus cereus group]|uniref:SMI1/KNR4 family protein n=1 Tax=Bacillus thuringiensis TaxID=1428 RepID=A0AAW4HRB9_BACTU|nr:MULTISPECIES: SMI1/KNR4 family protein [Bacillus cereus group]EKS7854562.1 SMI1/KNR4 family protein [Bacillus cereus]EKS7858978.1 SMI1/KNR4 family protein [Bacillus cereus]MBN9898012.1 SMI1/KNR4 family protein [Bacillus thuringiensis]MCH5471916.1 SMI1/KNR4 family protein [Bacillus cereus]MDY7520883.1 SMI1/KNR4 family protein [Bacillus thuringiensis]